MNPFLLNIFIVMFVASFVGGFVIARFLQLPFPLLIVWLILNFFVMLLQIGGLVFLKEIEKAENPKSYWAGDFSTFQDYVIATWREYGTADPRTVRGSGSVWAFQVINVIATCLLIFGVISQLALPSLAGLGIQAVSCLIYFILMRVDNIRPGIVGVTYLAFFNLLWILIPVYLIKQITDAM
jgi:hypothetical protein